VDIHYDVFDADGDKLKVRVEVSDNAGTKYSIPAFTFSGDIGDSISTGANKAIVWDAGKDWDGEYSDRMRVKVFAVDAKGFPGLAWGNEIPPGGFLMGQDGGNEGSGASRHVNIPWSYWLSKYEIRNDQYCEFLNTVQTAGEVYRDGTIAVRANIGRFAGVPGDVKLIDIGDSCDIRWNVNNFEVVGVYSNHPVRVSWYGAMAFAQHYGYDLPTEAEWEKAARGPDHDDQDEHFVYPWGDTLAGGNANYYASGDPYGGTKCTTPVGYFNGNQVPLGPDMVNAYGLYDVIGNVDEWCRSTPIATESYPQQETLTNSPNLIATSAARAFRGGSWGDSSSSVALKCYYRQSTSSTDSDNGDLNGFRVVRRNTDYVDAQPVCEKRENFDGADWPVRSSGTWTNTAASGTWVGSSSISVRNDPTNANSSAGCICLYPNYNTGYLTLPSTTGQLVGVACKARAFASDSSGYIEFDEYDGTSWNSCATFTVSGTGYRNINLTVTLQNVNSGKKFRICGYYLYLDDMELYTVPR